MKACQHGNAWLPNALTLKLTTGREFWQTSLPFFFEFLDLPPIALCRSALEKKWSRLFLELGGDCFAPLPAVIRLTIQFLRLGSRAALVGQCQYFDYILLLPDVDGEHISRSYCLGRLDTHLIDMHLAALDRVGCQGACFEETRSAKPFVDPEFFAIIAHTHLDMANTDGKKKFPQSRRQEQTGHSV